MPLLIRLIGALWLWGVWHCWSLLVQKSGEEPDDSPKHHNAEQHSQYYPKHNERSKGAHHICNPFFLNFATVLLLTIVLLNIVSYLPYNTLDIGRKLHDTVREWGRKRLPDTRREQHGSTTAQRHRQYLSLTQASFS